LQVETKSLLVWDNTTTNKVQQLLSTIITKYGLYHVGLQVNNKQGSASIDAMAMLRIVSNRHVRNQIVSLTLRILLMNVPLGASRCIASFVLLSPDFWLRLSFPSTSLNLYILVSSLDEQDVTHRD
jgi:hypothetical protein